MICIRRAYYVSCHREIYQKVDVHFISYKVYRIPLSPRSAHYVVVLPLCFVCKLEVQTRKLNHSSILYSSFNTTTVTFLILLSSLLKTLESVQNVLCTIRIKVHEMIQIELVAKIKFALFIDIYNCLSSRLHQVKQPLKMVRIFKITCNINNRL